VTAKQGGGGIAGGRRRSGVRWWGPLLVGWVCSRSSSTMYGRFHEAGGYSTSMPSGVYDLDRNQEVGITKGTGAILPDSQGHQPSNSRGPRQRRQLGL
jgi:hypothetical protein